MTTEPKQRRGFALLTPERRREIAKKGGMAVPDHKRSFAQDRALASAAGRAGGSKTQADRREP